MATDPEGEQQKRRRRRWGVAPSTTNVTASTTTTTTTSTSVVDDDGGSAPPTITSKSPPSSSSNPPDDPKAKVLAMQESIRARLAAAKAKQQQQQLRSSLVATTTATAVSSSITPSTTSTLSATLPYSASLKRPLDGTETSRDNQYKRAKRFDVDFTAPVSGPPKTINLLGATSSVGGKEASTAPPPKVNPYLAHRGASAVTAKPNQSNSSHRVTAKGSKVFEVEKNDTVTNEAKEEEIDVDVDPRLQRASKPRSRRRELKFVEPGHWQQIADKKREQAAKAEASGYVSGRKVGHTITSSTMAVVYGATSTGTGTTSTALLLEDDPMAQPRADAVPDPEGMPLVMEWWDLPLLPSHLKREVTAIESKVLSRQTKAAMQQLDDSNAPTTAPVTSTTSGEGGSEKGIEDGQTNHGQSVEEWKECEDLRMRCYKEASIMHSKTASLVQHIVPIPPPRPALERQPILPLTKKELKRQRKLRRQARQRELQDMQAAGLIPAPEPRLTLRNFIQVLGDQAYLDPSQMERKVQEQMEARQRAHLERNEANKLTKEQRAAKLARKYHEDTSAGVTVAVFYVLDLSHPYLRTKVDLNAQQNNISGGVLECQVPRLSCVICEGGPKAIKRYRRLMEVRMKWTGPDNKNESMQVDDMEEDDPEGVTLLKFNPNNKCELVWQGMAVKRYFKGFVFQSCETAEQARKVLKSKGVAHYWDQVLHHHQSGPSPSSLQLRLADQSSSSDSDSEDEVIVMKEET